MSDKPKVKFKWLEKLKNVKHIEIIVIAIFVIVIFLIYNSSFKSSSKGGTTAKSEEFCGEITITKYVSDLESNLEKTLSNIKGVSNVNVMITLDMSNMAIEDNIIQTSNFPSIKGIVIVANGVENTNVKLNVLKAVEAVIDINSGCIEILSSN